MERGEESDGNGVRCGHERTIDTSLVGCSGQLLTHTLAP